MTAVTHPRQKPRRGQVRPTSWWGRAWARAVEETAYSEGDLRSARSLARKGAVGQVTVDAGAFVAAVDEGDDAWTVQGRCEQVSGEDRVLFTELVAAEAGRVAALLGGDLPHTLVEDGEQAGLELLPYSGDLTAACGCDAWMDPCRHALAVGYQLGWLLDRDPFVLLLLRGIPREALLADLHALRSSDAASPGDATASSPDVGGSGRHDDPSSTRPEEEDPDLDAGAEAADRARRALALMEAGQPFEHLF